MVATLTMLKKKMRSTSRLHSKKHKTQRKREVIEKIAEKIRQLWKSIFFTYFFPVGLLFQMFDLSKQPIQHCTITAICMRARHNFQFSTLLHHPHLPTYQQKGPFSWSACWCQRPHCMGSRGVWHLQTLCTPGTCWDWNMPVQRWDLCVHVHKSLHPSLYCLFLPCAPSGSGEPCPHGRDISQE